MSHIVQPPGIQGEWNPRYSVDTGSPTIIHNLAATQGYYFKKGREVTLTWSIDTSSFTAAGNQKMRITAPFTCINTLKNVHFSGIISYSRGFSATTNPSTCLILENTNKIEMIINAGSDPRGEQDITLTETGMGATQNFMRGTLSYITNE